MAPVILACRRRADLRALVCATAQHRELMDEVHALFGIRSDFDLDLMRPGQSLPDLTARAVVAISDVVAAAKPDAALVQGDTTSAMAGALAAFYGRVPVAHVEAGLRTGDLAAPFPEELNRQIVARIAHWHFAPTARARDNLLAECVSPSNIVVTGNTGIDALRLVAASATPSDVLPELGLSPLGTAGTDDLVTSHRRENFGDRSRDVCRALADATDRWADLRVVYPVHPNQNVRQPVEQILSGRPRVHLVPPQRYGVFVRLMKQSWVIVTDSGGIQRGPRALARRFSSCAR